MPASKCLYKVISEKESFSKDLKVRRLDYVFQDRYDTWRHRGSRWLARAYTATLRKYLAARPHIDYQHKKNWARKISYIPYGFRSWAEYMPGGFATYYVYEPHHKRMANGKRLDAVTKRLFRHGIEGVGMRTRAYTLSCAVNSWISTNNMTSAHWLSIGCGSGQPTFDAASQLTDAVKRRSELVLVDRDSIVLDFAKSLYEHQRDILPRAIFSQADILAPSFFNELIEQMEPDVIDILGMFEYLDHEQSVFLLRRSYDSLREGGMMLFSNMDTNRPDYDINQRVIGWPALVLRTPEEILQIADEAGIARSDITFIRAQDAINNMFRVVKT